MHLLRFFFLTSCDDGHSDTTDMRCFFCFALGSLVFGTGHWYSNIFHRKDKQLVLPTGWCFAKAGGAWLNKCHETRRARKKRRRSALIVNLEPCKAHQQAMAEQCKGFQIHLRVPQTCPSKTEMVDVPGAKACLGLVLWQVSFCFFLPVARPMRFKNLHLGKKRYESSSFFKSKGLLYHHAVPKRLCGKAVAVSLRHGIRQLMTTATAFHWWHLS
jgi:hypothetical protein